MRSKVMTLEGKIIDIEDTFYGLPFFRKMIPKNKIDLDIKKGDENEKEIVHKLMKYQPTNIVKIYRIHDEDDFWYYDAELLDIYNTTNIENDIAMALEQLHNIGIIYIDLKKDNIGYSHKDKKWKLFDFNASGVTLDFKTWIAEPPKLAAYKIALQKKHHLPGYWQNVDTIKYIFEDFCEIDWIAFEIFQQTC